MANPVSSFCDYYRVNPDPYPDAAAFYTPFRADPAVLPATIINSLESPTYPIALLMAGTDHRPLAAVAPFSPVALPGMGAAANKYVFVGDVSANGALPALVSLTNNCFHLTDNVDVLAAAELAAAWAALPAGEDRLPPPAAGANVEQKRTRSVMPIPHPYAGPILEQMVAGTLTWRWLYENVATTVRGDPAQALAYAELVNYIDVSSTRRPGVGGGPDRDPQMEMNHVGVLTMPALQECAMTVGRNFLPVQREAIGLIISSWQLDKP